VPRPGTGEHERVFDGLAVGINGRVLLRMRGYRPADLGVAASTVVSRRITERIGRHRAGPQVPSLTSSEGVSL